MKGMGNDLIREARKRRGLTQRELAELAGTTQSAIARLEAAKTAPSFVDFMLVERDDSDWIQARRSRTATPAQRHDQLVAWKRSVDNMRRDFDRSVA